MMLFQVSKKSRPANAHQKKPTRSQSRPLLDHTVSGIVTRSVVGLMAVGFLLSGCATVGPDFVPPKAPEAKEWIEKEDPKIKSEPADFSKWWTVFDDPVLSTLIQTAYEQNLGLRIAGIRILGARAQLGVAVGRQYPQQQVGAGDISYNRLSENAPNQSFADKNFYNLGIGFDAAWELDFWGRFRRGVESANASLIATIATYDDILVTLAAEVARTYTLVRTFEQRIEIARENVKIQKRSLEIAQVRFEAGDVSELDVAQAKSLLHDTEALIPRFETGRRQGKNALSILLGKLPGEVDEILGGSKPIPTAPMEVAVGIPAELLRRRPDVRRAELQAAAQSARIGVAKSDLYPRFALVGSIGLATSDSGGFQSNNASFSDLFDSDSITYLIGAGFQWPILNYGRIKNSVRVQDARFQTLVVNYKNTVLQAAQEAEDAIVAFLRTQEEAKYLSDSVVASKRAVDLSMVQYREGLVSYQRVLDTQRFLTLGQDNLTATVGNVAVSVIAIYKALGGGWQVRLGKDFVPEETREEMRKRTDWGDILPPKDLPKDLEPPPTGKAVKIFHSPDW
jgi:NodT family efflux transporter outer membrane factor (OMF) lipoprotein